MKYQRLFCYLCVYVLMSETNQFWKSTTAAHHASIRLAKTAKKAGI
jgi:hypothetical protein